MPVFTIPLILILLGGTVMHACPKCTHTIKPAEQTHYIKMGIPTAPTAPTNAISAGIITLIIAIIILYVYIIIST